MLKLNDQRLLKTKRKIINASKNSKENYKKSLSIWYVKVRKR